ncbi:hypothetical protein GCM10027355_08820 [Haloplanus salinarum]
MTRPRPSSSHRRAHHRDRAPECPTCETNLFVAADRGRDGERRCHHCGWTTTLDDGGDGDGSRAHGPARESAPHNPQGGCATHTVCRDESQDGDENDRVAHDGSLCYGGVR